MRTTALPETGRPTISRWRPRWLTAGRQNASPRPSRRSTASSALSASSGSSHAAKLRTRRDAGASATTLKSPSIDGSASGRSHAMTIWGSLRTISAARSTRTDAFASSASISLTRRAQARRAARCRSAAPAKATNRTAKPMTAMGLGVRPAGGGDGVSRPRSASSARAPNAIRSESGAAAATGARRRLCMRPPGPAKTPPLNPRNDKPPREPGSASASGRRADRLPPPGRSESAPEQAYEMFAPKSLTMILGRRPAKRRRNSIYSVDQAS